MKHFICTGECGMEKSDPGTCQTADCSKQGEQFTACDCEDGEHYGATQIVGESAGDDQNEQ
jgi:hypothetical protein